MSVDRWNAALLLAKANTNNATNLTPVTTFSARTGSSSPEMGQIR